MAAFDFPNSPTNGQQYTANGVTFVYNSTANAWSPVSTPEHGYVGGAVLNTAELLTEDQAYWGSGDQLDITALSASKAVAVWSDDAAAELYAAVVDISGTTATAGTPTLVDGDGINAARIVALSSTKAAVVYSNGTDTDLVAVILDISGTTITVGTPVVLYSSLAADSFKICAVSSTVVAVGFIDNTAADLYAVMFSVSGSTITAGTALLAGAGTYFRVASIGNSGAVLHLVAAVNNQSVDFYELSYSGLVLTYETINQLLGVSVTSSLVSAVSDLGGHTVSWVPASDKFAGLHVIDTSLRRWQGTDSFIYAEGIYFSPGCKLTSDKCCFLGFESIQGADEEIYICSLIQVKIVDNLPVVYNVTKLDFGPTMYPGWITALSEGKILVAGWQYTSGSDTTWPPIVAVVELPIL